MEKLGPGALIAAVASLIGGIAVLDATGLVGRIERNHTAGFSVALGLTLVGTFLAALLSSKLFGGTADDEKTAKAAESASRAAEQKAAKAEERAHALKAKLDAIGSTPTKDQAKKRAKRAADADAAAAEAVRARDQADSLESPALAHIRVMWHRNGVNALRLVAAVLMCTGVIWVVVLAIISGGTVGQPSVKITLTAVEPPAATAASSSPSQARTYRADVETRMTDLPADRRVTVLVDGLTLLRQTHRYWPKTLFHGRYGPNADGVVDVHSVVEITRGSTALEPGANFTAVGVQARVVDAPQRTEPIHKLDDSQGDAEPSACGNYEEKVSANGAYQNHWRTDFAPGCVIMVLPGPAVSGS